MTEKSLAQKATALATKAHKIKKPAVVEHAQALDPTTNQTLHRFRVTEEDGNGPAYFVFLDERGEAVETSAAVEALFAPSVPPGPGTAPAPAAPPITINPDSNVLTLNPTDTLDETITVTVPAGNGVIQNVKLVPSPSIAGFITSITPAAGYGPLPPNQNQILTFDVKFHGIPCTAEQQVISGTIDVVVVTGGVTGGPNTTIVASKKVQITVPPCPARQFVYAVKFVCGVQPECGCECVSVQPGRYATEINIHNYSSKEIRILKRFIPVVLAGAAVGREPGTAASRAEETITLPPHSATMDDCCRISELLFGAAPAGSIPVTIGFLEITATAELAVTAVYTASGLQAGGVSIDVVQITAQRA
jgi:hypothetical protein